MIRGDDLQRFEMEILRKEKLDILRNFRIEKALYREAVVLDIFPLKNPLDGLEVDIKIARAINCISKTA